VTSHLGPLKTVDLSHYPVSVWSNLKEMFSKKFQLQHKTNSPCL